MRSGQPSAGGCDHAGKEGEAALAEQRRFFDPVVDAGLRGEGKFSGAVQALLQAQSQTGPGGKPEMMYELAMALEDPNDVPEQLRTVFAELRTLDG